MAIEVGTGNDVREILVVLALALAGLLLAALVAFTPWYQAVGVPAVELHGPAVSGGPGVAP